MHINTFTRHVFMVEALEMIGFQHHLEKHGRLYADCDSTSHSDAQQVLGSITSFEFILMFLLYLPISVTPSWHHRKASQ